MSFDDYPEDPMRVSVGIRLNASITMAMIRDVAEHLGVSQREAKKIIREEMEFSVGDMIHNYRLAIDDRGCVSQAEPDGTPGEDVKIFSRIGEERSWSQTNT